MTERETYPVLSVEAAREHILAQVRPLAPERLPILRALGRVLAKDVISESDIPPHANSAMDGYALRVADLAATGPLRLRLAGEAPAGSWRSEPVAAGEAVRIMTGAPIPPGADTVVRFEDASQEGDTVILQRRPSPGRDVRAVGEDVRAGQTVLATGAVLRPQEIGMLAALGRAEVAVIRQPLVAVLSTGDEVAPLGAPLQRGQIRDSNSYSLCAQVLEAGGEPLLLEVAPDHEAALTGRLRQALEAGADLIVTSGGVSVGDFDLTKRVLAAEGALDFWWVNIKPGRPMAFGRLGAVPLLALPGNPVAAMLSFMLFGRATVRKMRGHARWDLPTTSARLREEISRKDGRRHYLRVRLHAGNDGDEAVLTGDQGSGILLSMVTADGLAVIPEDRDRLPAGSEVEIILFPSCERGT
jgi:molybdopterin molybdotransferase